MKDPNIFLYICLVRYKAINLILKKFRKYNISIILDMEDSAQDLFDHKNNENLKIKLEIDKNDISMQKLSEQNKELNEENNKLKEEVLFYEKMIGKRRK